MLEKENIIANLNSETKNGVIKELSDQISSTKPSIDSGELYEVLLKREKLCSTAMNSGVAIPHGKLSGLNNIVAGIARSKKGIEFDALDGEKTSIFILLVSPERSNNKHINLLARFSKIFKKAEIRKKILNAKSSDEIYEIIIEEDEKLQ